MSLNIARSIAYGGIAATQVQISVPSANITNADTVVNKNVAVGSTYLLPAGGDPILSPRIIRVGFSLNF